MMTLILIYYVVVKIKIHYCIYIFMYNLDIQLYYVLSKRTNKTVHLDAITPVQ